MRHSWGMSTLLQLFYSWQIIFRNIFYGSQVHYGCWRWICFFPAFRFFFFFIERLVWVSLLYYEQSMGLSRLDVDDYILVEDVFDLVEVLFIPCPFPIMFFLQQLPRVLQYETLLTYLYKKLLCIIHEVSFKLHIFLVSNNQFIVATKPLRMFIQQMPSRFGVDHSFSISLTR